MTTEELDGSDSLRQDARARRAGVGPRGTSSTSCDVTSCSPTFWSGQPHADPSDQRTSEYALAVAC